MGLYGDILRATDGSIFTFDKIYTITTDFFEAWANTFKEMSAEDQNYINDAQTTITNAWGTQEIANYSRLLSQKQLMSIVKGLANGDDVFVGRYILIEGVNQVFTKVYRNKSYEYVKVADLNTLDLLNEANTDEWLNIEQVSAALKDIKLVHADPAPPIVDSNGNFLYPVNSQADETTSINLNYFKPINETDLAVAPKGWAAQGIMSSYYDGKGHQVKNQYEYSEKYVKVSSDSLKEFFDSSMYYVPYYEDKEVNLKKLYVNIPELIEQKIEIDGYIKLSHWNGRSDTYKGDNGQGINDKSYSSEYFYYLRIIEKKEVTYVDDKGNEYSAKFTHLVSENDDYTLILNGGYYLNETPNNKN